MTDRELRIREKEAVQPPGEPTKTQQELIPLVDIYETADQVTVLAEMPGVESKDVEVHLEEGILTIKGNRQDEIMPGETFLHREFEAGCYVRQFAFSESVDRKKIEAVMKNGILSIRLPKINPAAPQKIAVEIG